MQNIGLYEHLKFIGDSTPKLCRFNIISFDSMHKFYRVAVLVYDEQQIKINIEMVYFFNTKHNYIYIINKIYRTITPIEYG